MQPSIPVGTLLHNRYGIIRLLGQGGFGRTYLASDRDRFDEWCAIKEFIPPQGDPNTLAKSQELFRREASTLYQIQHPQVPQFRAMFEENGRLFLVQDYVEGKTYSALLAEHQALGRNFSIEAVMQLLQQLLPVLSHIHNKGIIHRDISPDNIIWRQSDGLPILIDFGVVKEAVTRFQTNQEAVKTTVGKMGYAPSEQLQTGQVYPSSDLYALAVTAIVLLTGRQPSELFDPVNAVWRWQPLVPIISPQFAQVLNRMLSYRPGDRYASANEVLAALGSGVMAAPRASQVPLSQVKTIAVGRSQSSVPRLTKTVPQPTPESTSIWENPWIMLLMGLTIVALAGLGSWTFVRSLLISSPNPTPTPTLTLPANPIQTPSPTPVSTPEPKPTPIPTPALYSETLNLAIGQPLQKKGKLQVQEIHAYILSVAAGQHLKIDLQGTGIAMIILDPNQTLLGQQQAGSWEQDLAATGNYTIQLKTAEGIQDSEYVLDLNLTVPATPEPSPSLEASPPPSPSPEASPVASPSPEASPPASPSLQPSPVASPSSAASPL
jgi:serine/threonine-protein kinase